MDITSTILSRVATTALPTMKKITVHFFSWYDYGIFSAMLAMSMGIGIYFGFFAKKQTTTKDYLRGGGDMKIFPVVISLIASHTSGVTLLGLPSEVYIFGATYWLTAISFIFVIAITIFVFLPVFHKLQLTSVYEYLGLRFNGRCRKLSSILFALSIFMHLPIIVYIPALAFSAASGVDVHIITPIVCGICIFYTTFGGLKALVWSDTVLFTVTTVTISIISFLGIHAAGGVGNVFRTAIEGHRLDIWQFDFDLVARDSFWTIVLGFTCHLIGITTINQGCTQKFLSVAELRDCNITVVFYCLGMVLIKTLCIICGILIYVRYALCDPLTTKQITKSDEIFPFYVLDVAGNIPGLSGLFIAGVFCASLSAQSCCLNCVAGTIYEDFLKTTLEKKGYKNPTFSLKLLVAIIGIIGTLMVYIVEHLGGLLALAIGIGGVTSGPLLGLFTMGVLFPRGNAFGAFYGAITSTLCMFVIMIGNSYYKMNKMLHYRTLPTSVENCDFYDNSTITLNSSSSNDTYIYPIFKISHYWFTMIGTIICLTVGLFISYLSKEAKSTVAKELLSPSIYGLIDEKKYINKMDLDYSSVEDALNKLENGDAGRRRSSKWEALREERLRRNSSIKEPVFDV
ncbi:sodium-coupled monocarboxylate transporter 2 [Leptinotarsa decemlineata]|uniref:sodium-coupled monocarboxylate transporter 2 n=1 Tax=Leptinotarsa decemlineata TaxID=7539 RepID=UPI003D3049CE